MTFKIGDRVKHKRYGEGVVVGFRASLPCVEFDNANFELHDGDDGSGVLGKDSHCWFCCDNDLTKIMSETIIIFRNNNNTITATRKLGKEVVKTAEAKCNPDDDFDFDIGAKLAFERLMGVEDKPLIKEEFIEVDKNAKMGEFIKIVAPDRTSDIYKKGDILKVVRVGNYGVYAETNGTHPCNIGKNTSFISSSEYVVVEKKEVEGNLKTYTKDEILELVEKLFL